MTVKEEHYHSMEVLKKKFLKLGKVCTHPKTQVFVSFCQEFSDVFAWEYYELKGFDPHLAQHTIELEPQAKLVRQKQRPHQSQVRGPNEGRIEKND